MPIETCVKICPQERLFQARPIESCPECPEPGTRLQAIVTHNMFAIGTTRTVLLVTTADLLVAEI
jgi:hypothetical protein